MSSLVIFKCSFVLRRPMVLVHDQTTGTKTRKGFCSTKHGNFFLLWFHFKDLFCILGLLIVTTLLEHACLPFWNGYKRLKCLFLLSLSLDSFVSGPVTLRLWVYFHQCFCFCYLIFFVIMFQRKFYKGVRYWGLSHNTWSWIRFK